jgi:transposase-like protein
MTLDQNNYNGLMLKLFEELNNTHSGGIRSLLEGILNMLMKLERENAIQAKPYERSPERQGYANGFKERVLNTRMGSLELQIPQVRGLSFYPQCIEKGCRSERALKLAVAEMYLKGVSTRKVEAVTQVLCGMDFTSTQVSRATKELDGEFELFRNRLLGSFKYLFLDATYLKVRHSGTVINQSVLVAYGVNDEGKREIVGTSISLSEAEVHWRIFLESLVKRGLNGLELITSDDHVGLRNARQKVFPSVPWQRCQFHMSQNAQSYAPKKSLKEPIGQAMRDIFNSPDLNNAKQRAIEASKNFIKTAPEFSSWLENNIEEGLTCFNFPRNHRIKIRTSNGLERVNREIKRRTRVAVLFPNAESALRLVTGVLIEIHEDWITDKVYLKMPEKNGKTFQMAI